MEKYTIIYTDFHTCEQILVRHFDSKEKALRVLNRNCYAKFGAVNKKLVKTEDYLNNNYKKWSVEERMNYNG